jgi:eukaryotic-like serine/threonine-protein kinase
MALAPGARIGPYEILASIGAGGMGEVYRARDDRLQRDVAIKILPDAFAGDPERLARFEREARTLASLNHAHIAQVYGLERVDPDRPATALVMELVPGDDLSQRIARGAIPLDEALPIAQQIVEALTVAHEHGIVHRDLKPANVKLAPGGSVKVLDFGLAKSAATAPAGGDDGLNSPTVASPGLTVQGALLGTAAYMSPEQARGKPVDVRTDIWAFGCILFEMLTGARAFAGDTVADTIAAVVRAEPEWLRLPADLPTPIRTLLRRCLQKDPHRRLPHIGGARLEIEDAQAGPAGPLPSVGPRQRRMGWLAAATACLLSSIGGGLVGWRAARVPGRQAPALRVVIQLPADQHLVEASFPPLSISADGHMVAFSVTRQNGATHLLARALDQWEPRAVPGTDGAELSFFSSDRRWLGYVANGALFKTAVDGGVPVRIGELPFRQARGAVWTADNRIVFNGGNTGLYSMNAETGATSVLTTPDAARGEQYHAWPDLLPDGEHVLFSSVTHNDSTLAVLSLRTGRWRLIDGLRDAAHARYLDSGHVVFLRAGALFAVPFSREQLTPTGAAVPIVREVFLGWSAGLDFPYYAASRSGTLLYVAGAGVPDSRYVRVDRAGRTGPLLSDPVRHYPNAAGSFHITVSADGRRVALAKRSGRPSSDLWTYDVDAGTGLRLTRQDANISPVWSADSRRVFFACFAKQSFDLCSIAPDASGPATVVFARERDQFPTSVSRNDGWLAFHETTPAAGLDLHILRLDGDHGTQAIAATPADEMDASFSPDSRYLAYSSNESGRHEVYVQAIAGGRGKTNVSRDGGRLPKWSADGKELFFLRGTAIMSVGVTTRAALQVTSPRLVLDGDYAELFDPFPDGQHFARLTVSRRALAQIHAVLGWSAELPRE